MTTPAAVVSDTARDQAERIVRDVLSPPDPLKPGKKLKQPHLINLTTGALTQALPKALQQIKANGGWYGPVCNDPRTNLSADIKEYIMFDQRIFINHPLVSQSLVHSGFAPQQQQQLSVET
jgi:hypothetical protein